MTDTTAGVKKKKKLATVVKAIEKAWGPIHLPVDHSLLDQSVYLILRENWDYRKATKALLMLQQDFVDWNEIRVTTAGELRGSLAPMGDRDVDVKIERIRTLLGSLYRDRNGVDMDFLRDEDEDERKRFLYGLRAFGDAQVEIITMIAGATRE